jgi:hypothetical protein
MARRLPPVNPILATTARRHQPDLLGLALKLQPSAQVGRRRADFGERPRRGVPPRREAASLGLQAGLLGVISAGERLLNIRFDERLKIGLVDGAFESVAVLQEACYGVCERAGVIQTLDEPRTIGEDADASDVIRTVVDEQSGRYTAFLTRFATGFRQTDLEMYKWLLYPVLRASPDGLEAGVPLGEINRTLRAVHPRGEELNPGHVIQALKSAASLQVQLGIKPLILDYHEACAGGRTGPNRRRGRRGG